MTAGIDPATLIVALILCLAAAAAVRKIVRDRRKGKRSCGFGCSCDSCASAAFCRKMEEKDTDR